MQRRLSIRSDICWVFPSCLAPSLGTPSRSLVRARGLQAIPEPPGGLKMLWWELDRALDSKERPGERRNRADRQAWLPRPVILPDCAPNAPRFLDVFGQRDRICFWQASNHERPAHFARLPALPLAIGIDRGLCCRATDTSVHHSAQSPCSAL